MAYRTKARSRSFVGVVATVVVLLAVSVGCKTDNSILRQRGFAAIQHNNDAAAMEAFELAISQDPTDWQAHYQRGKLLMKQARHLDARLAFEKARGVRPDHAETPQLIDSIAEAMYQQGRYDSLNELLTEATVTFGLSHDFLRQGDYLIRLGDMDAARVALLKAAQFAEEGDTEPHIKLATFYEQVGDSIRAIGAWKRAYHFAPGNTHVANMLRQHGIVLGPTLAAPPRR